MAKHSAGPICIVDDDSSIRKALSRLFSLEGWEVRAFENGEQFVAYASDHEVPIVILDICMPGTSGLEIQAKLVELSPGCRVIIMTPRSDNSLRAAARKGGATDFFLKPFDNENLLRAVHDALDG